MTRKDTKRTRCCVLVISFIMLLSCLVGCASVVDKAENLVKEGKYQEAISILQEDSSEEAKEALEQYVRMYAEELMASGKYQEAKDTLLTLDEGSYEEKALIICNIGIVQNAIEAVGKKGDEGKRVYVNSGDGIAYLENLDSNTLILGYDMSNGVGGNQFKLYIDGTNTPYFEGATQLSFTLLGHTVNSSTEGFGTVDITVSTNKLTLNVDDFNNKGAVDTSGNTVIDLEDEKTFTERFNKILKDIVKALPALLEKTDSEITMIELGFGVGE